MSMATRSPYSCSCLRVDDRKVKIGRTAKLFDKVLPNLAEYTLVGWDRAVNDPWSAAQSLVQRYKLHEYACRALSIQCLVLTVLLENASASCSAQLCIDWRKDHLDLLR
ncbi:hypothetical protein BD311DRAFT_769463 [Dichomitus squalens]|uniref:Uncharacterized protein n=1 Tax=Dichomitus squalens TaxID=114155 RepID=A0A4V2JYY3_9APHY|nr:hypothetical protein BD311DRAFT_769463 [Dichomitus squalens]